MTPPERERLAARFFELDALPRTEDGQNEKARILLALLPERGAPDWNHEHKTEDPQG